MDDPANRKEEFDRPYVEILFERYGNAMFHTAWRILLDEGLAEDAVMISLEKIHENIDRFYGISEYHTANMVRKYTDHAARDLRRKKNRRERYEYSAGDDIDLSASADAEPDELTADSLTDEDYGVLLRAMKKLGEKYRTVLSLRYVEEYGVREIAKMLRIPASTVTTRISRGRQLLRKAYEEEKNGGT